MGPELYAKITAFVKYPSCMAHRCKLILPANLPEKHAGIQEGPPFVTRSFATDKKHGNVSKKTP